MKQVWLAVALAVCCVVVTRPASAQDAPQESGELDAPASPPVSASEGPDPELGDTGDTPAVREAAPPARAPAAPPAPTARQPSPNARERVDPSGTAMPPAQPPPAIPPPPAPARAPVIPGVVLPPADVEPAPPPMMLAPFTVRLNEAERGQLTLVLEGDDVYMDPEDLALLGVAPLRGTTKTFLDRPWLSLKSVSPPLRYSLDERAIELKLTVPPELLPKTVIDVNNVPVDVQYQTRTGGFVNYSIRTFGSDTVTGYQEVGVSHDGNLALSTMFLSNIDGAVRGMTSYTMNERETLRRMTIGDAFVQAGPLGSTALLGGMTLERTFELDPYLVTSPRIGFSGTAYTPSTLEVYVNGALVRREKVQPGTFDLQNLRVGGGSGTTTYVLRDVFGQEQRLTIPFYISSSVLTKGLQEYTYSLGSVRQGLGEESWDYRRPALVGRHRIGIDRAVTLSGHVEVTETLIAGGPGVTALTPVGQFEVEVAGSRERGVPAGFASFASWAYLSGMLSVGARAQFASNHYATVATPGDLEKLTKELSVFAGVPIAGRASLAGSARYAEFRYRGRGLRAELSAGMRIWGMLSGNLNAGIASSDELGMSWDTMLGLAYVFAQRNSSSANLYASDRGVSTTLAANRSPASAGYDYGYRASGQLGELSSANLFAQGQTPYARFGAGYNVAETNFGTRKMYTTEVAGALVMVPDVGMFATLPVYNGFGVIQLPGVPNVRGYINNLEAGRTNRRGNLVVPNVLPYYGNRFSIAPEDVPMRFQLSVPELVVAPPQRGVAVATFPIYEPHYYRGKITLRMGDKLEAPQFGELRVVTPLGDRYSPLGAKGEFELEGMAPGTYRAFVLSAAGRCELDLVTTASDETVIELGEVTCDGEPIGSSP